MGLRAVPGTVGIHRPWTGDCPSPWSGGSEGVPGRGCPLGQSWAGSGIVWLAFQRWRSRVIFAALLCFLSPRFLVMIAEWFCFFFTLEMDLYLKQAPVCHAQTHWAPGQAGPECVV